MDPLNNTPTPDPTPKTPDAARMPEGQTIDLSGAPAPTTQPSTPQAPATPHASPSTLPGVEVSSAQASPVSPSAPAQLPDIGSTAMDDRKRAFYKSRLFFGGLLGLIAAIIVGTTYVVFAYVPNTPQNIWRRGMASIGVGLEEVISNGFEGSTNTNTNFTGNFTISSPESVNIDFNGSYDVAGNGALDFDADFAGESYGLDAVYRLSGEDNLPQIFFRPSGIESVIVSYLGIFTTDDVLAGQQIDDVWWILDYQELVDRGLLSIDEINDLQDSDGQLSQQDYEDFMTAILSAANEHIFTSDESQMIFNRQEDLGEEDYEGVLSQKYSLTLNKDNLAAFLKLARDNVEQTGIRDKLGIDKPFTEEGLTDQQIDDAVNDIDEDNFDMQAWVAKDSKVLRNVRFVNPDEEDNYIDVSMLLSDGVDSEELPVRVLVSNSDQSYDGTMSLTMTMNRNNSDVSFEASGDLRSTSDFGQDVKFDMTMLLSGTAEAPALEIPSDARSFLDLIDTVLSPQPASTPTDGGSDTLTLGATDGADSGLLGQINFYINALGSLDELSDQQSSSTLDIDIDGLELDVSASIDQDLLNELQQQLDAGTLDIDSEQSIQEALDAIRRELDETSLEI